MNNALFKKIMEYVRKHKDIILVTTERRKNDVVSQLNFCTTKFFTENVLPIEMRKAETLMN